MNEVIQEKALPQGAVLQLVRGDLTIEKVDAIVNAANSHLMHGGGVAGAISKRGGPQIDQESRAWVQEHGPVSHLEPAYTSGGRMDCRYVIHAVGPVWGEGGEDAKLEAAVRAALRLAEQLDLASISFPAISTGIFGFPKDRAARIMLAAIQAHFNKKSAGSLKQVRLVLIDPPTMGAFLKAWKG